MILWGTSYLSFFFSRWNHLGQRDAVTNSRSHSVEDGIQTWYSYWYVSEFHTTHFTDEATEIQSNWLNSHHPTPGSSHDTSPRAAQYVTVWGMRRSRLWYRLMVISTSVTASVTIYTWMMTKSLSRPEYPTVHMDSSTGMFWRLSKMQPSALPLLLFLQCPVTWWNIVLSLYNMVVENVTLELAWWDLNSDSATYYVTLGLHCSVTHTIKTPLVTLVYCLRGPVISSK